RFVNNEKENFDISGAYLFGDRDFDNTSSSFGLIINPLGAGFYQDYARNSLNITSWNIAHKGTLQKEKHFIQWGVGFENTRIDDHLKQWQYQDSAGYNIPYVPGTLNFLYSVNSKADLNINKYTAYIQDNVFFHQPNINIALQGGVRFNYNDLN